MEAKTILKPSVIEKISSELIKSISQHVSNNGLRKYGIYSLGSKSEPNSYSKGGTAITHTIYIDSGDNVTELRNFINQFMDSYELSSGYKNHGWHGSITSTNFNTLMSDFWDKELNNFISIKMYIA